MLKLGAESTLLKLWRQKHALKLQEPRSVWCFMDVKRHAWFISTLGMHTILLSRKLQCGAFWSRVKKPPILIHILWPWRWAQGKGNSMKSCGRYLQTLLLYFSLSLIPYKQSVWFICQLTSRFYKCVLNLVFQLNTVQVHSEVRSTAFSRDLPWGQHANNCSMCVCVF